MSWYYQMKFTSPSPLYAEVKETLRSYFDTGAVDDMMFPIWTEQCLRRFRMSAYKIEPVVMDVEDYTTCLPDDFNSVREAWLCETTFSNPVRDASSIYYQTDCRISNITDSCNACFTNSPTCEIVGPDGCCNSNEEFEVINKINGASIYRFTRKFLLRPGNINAVEYGGQPCLNNMYGAGERTYDIRDGKMILNCPFGQVLLIYYANPTDANGDQLVPEDYWVQDFIRKFLKFKIFEQMSNQVTDETFNQIQMKLQRADQEQGEAFILAETELKKQTIEQKNHGIIRSYNRNNKYTLPGDQSRWKGGRGLKWW